MQNTKCKNWLIAEHDISALLSRDGQCQQTYTYCVRQLPVMNFTARSIVNDSIQSCSTRISKNTDDWINLSIVWSSNIFWLLWHTPASNTLTSTVINHNCDSSVATAAPRSSWHLWFGVNYFHNPTVPWIKKFSFVNFQQIMWTLYIHQLYNITVLVRFMISISLVTCTMTHVIQSAAVIHEVDNRAHLIC